MPELIPGAEPTEQVSALLSFLAGFLRSENAPLPLLQLGPLSLRGLDGNGPLRPPHPARGSERTAQAFRQSDPAVFS